MCVAGMFKSVGTTFGSLFYAKGRPDLELKLDIVFFLTIVPLLILGINIGIIGVSIVVVVHSLMMGFLYFSFSARLIRLRLVDFPRALYPAISLSSVMIVVLIIYRFGFQLLLQNETILLISSICLGALVYIILLRRFCQEVYEGTIGVLIKKLPTSFLRRGMCLYYGSFACRRKGLTK